MAAVGHEVAVGDDGTVIVASQELHPATLKQGFAIRIAVGRAGAPLVSSRVGRSGTTPLGIAAVRGEPQLAWLQRVGARRFEVHVVSAAAGTLGRSRREAVLGRHDAGSVTLQRSARGDRLLRWSNGRRHWVRVGAPGRPLASPLSFVAEFAGLRTALNGVGDFAVLSRRSSRRVESLRLLRGRTSSRRVTADRLTPPHGVSENPVGFVSASLAIDPRGRTYVVHVTPAQPLRGRLRLTFAGHSAARGRPFPRGTILSSRRWRGNCSSDLVVLGTGRAVARWSCIPRDDAREEFTEQARFSLGG